VGGPVRKGIGRWLEEVYERRGGNRAERCAGGGGTETHEVPRQAEGYDAQGCDGAGAWVAVSCQVQVGLHLRGFLSITNN
jgi:hypothetical protein